MAQALIVAIAMFGLSTAAAVIQSTASSASGPAVWSGPRSPAVRPALLLGPLLQERLHPLGHGVELVGLYESHLHLARRRGVRSDPGDADHERAQRIAFAHGSAQRGRSQDVELDDERIRSVHGDQGQRIV